MQSTDITVLGQVRDWLSAGYKVWLVTVLSTYGSSPRQPGAMCAIRDDGALIGSVSGGCIEEDLLEKVQTGQLSGKILSFLTYGESINDRDRFRLPCGGTLRLCVEMLTNAAWITPVIKAIENRQTIKRSFSLANKSSHVEPAKRAETPIIEDMDKIHFVYGPRNRLLLIGAGETATYLASMATALDYQVLVAEPREDMQMSWQSSEAELLKMMPDDAVVKIQPDSHTSIITLTHDPKLDDMALLEALKSDAEYIGALGSNRTNAKRRERLALFDLTAEQIARLHGPVGLDIGSKTPAEIAVSILAELIQLKQAKAQKKASTDIRAVSNG